MSLLQKYEKLTNTTNLVGDAKKSQTSYNDRVQKVNSYTLSQVESPVGSTLLAPKPGDASYTQTVFEESVN